MAQPSGLRIRGARQNNLKNISLEIPHDRLTVVTGVSGSGKSSLAFDTLFAEGQWRYIESLSTYARLFLDRLDRPDADGIGQIRPAVALARTTSARRTCAALGASHRSRTAETGEAGLREGGGQGGGGGLDGRTPTAAAAPLGGAGGSTLERAPRLLCTVTPRLGGGAEGKEC